jgi:hypothetical protein
VKGVKRRENVKRHSRLDPLFSIAGHEAKVKYFEQRGVDANRQSQREHCHEREYRVPAKGAQGIAETGRASRSAAIRALAWRTL